MPRGRRTVDGRCAAGDAQFAVDVLEVLGDGARDDVEGAGDGQVGAAARGELEDLYLAVGQAGETAGPRRRQGGTGAVPIARPPERIAQRLLDGAEHGAVLGEVASGPAHREGGHPAFGHGGHAEGNLVINGYVPEILRVNAQPVESLPADEVADLGWPRSRLWCGNEQAGDARAGGPRTPSARTGRGCQRENRCNNPDGLDRR